MKLSFLLCLLLTLVVPAAAATTNKADKTQATLKPAAGKPAQKATTSVSPSGGVNASAGETPAAAPAPAPTPVPPSASQTTLDAYVAALADEMTLSKDEKTDIQTYYLDDGPKLNGILNNDSLSPLEQTRQVDVLRDIRNGKIDALLGDVTRQSAFAKVEAGYRVALTELAAKGGLFPKTTPPRVPEPTVTTPAQAEKNSKGTTS